MYKTKGMCHVINLRRSFDVMASAGGLIALSPIFVATAAISALHFKASPVFTDDRIGKDHKPFKMLKWRTMSSEVDADGNPLPDQNRTSKYGRFLRGTAIDETLQLVNILKGDMSFFGPRPHWPVEVESWQKNEESQKYNEILSVRPGLTGAWQVASIGDQTGESGHSRLDMELASVRANRSLLQDLGLIARSIPALYKGHNGETPRIGPK